MLEFSERKNIQSERPTMQDFVDDFRKLNLNDFDYVIGQCEKAMVLFTASWCGPCKMLKPKMPDLAKEYYPNLRVFWVDIEECMDLTSQYKIQAVPFIATFKNGALFDSAATSSFSYVSNMALRVIESGD
jgi:thioredoxin 1